MKQITDRELKSILKNHKLWLEDHNRGKRADLSDTDLHEAKLSFSDLSYANLTGADLKKAQLNGAFMACVNLSHADLSYADMTGAYLWRAALTGANLNGTTLKYAIFNNADLSDANLQYAALTHAELYFANLTHADLSNACLTGTNLTGAIRSGSIGIPGIKCPSAGEFVGWKIAQKHLVKLLIPKDARRSSAVSSKCRCSKAKVIGIFSLKGKEIKLSRVHSDYDSSFVYRVGDMVEVHDFDDNRWKECTAGIHFFMTPEEASDYAASA